MRRAFCLLASLVATTFALVGAAQAEGGFYLRPSEVDLVHVLAPPPPAESPAAKGDLQDVLSAVASRTDVQIEHARAGDQRTVFRFADVVGPAFRMEGLPLTAQLFQHVYQDGNAATLAAKAYFKRQRPFVVDPDIKIIVEQAPDFSYPSNHSTFAYEAAILLASMVPEKAAAIFARATDYAHNRVVVPTDVEAGLIGLSCADLPVNGPSRLLADFVAKAECLFVELQISTCNEEVMPILAMIPGGCVGIWGCI